MDDSKTSFVRYGCLKDVSHTAYVYWDEMMSEGHDLLVIGHWPSTDDPGYSTIHLKEHII